MTRKVLLIEDSPTMAFVIKEALVASGFSVTVADNGAHALMTARKVLPNVIVLNKMLPGLDGYEVTRQLREDPVLSAVRIMMLTESGRKEDVVRGIKGGADDYMLKPFEPEELAQRVERLFRRISTSTL